MASINGVQIKALHSFMGVEGPTLQGNVYRDGKKLGFWSQDGNGGPDRFEFNEDVLDDVVEKLRISSLIEDEYREIVNADILMYELTKLMEDEKNYKKMAKQGYPIVFLASDGYHVLTFAVRTGKVEDIIQSDRYLQWTKKAKESMYENVEMTIKSYTSLDDFKLVV